MDEMAETLEANGRQRLDGPMRSVRAGAESEVSAAWLEAEAISLAQAWMPLGAFSAGTVRLAHTSDALWVQADLQDEDIYSEATQDSQRMWEMGDVFEMFLQADSVGGYVEMHVSPNNKRLHLRFGAGDFGLLASGHKTFVSLTTNPPRFESQTFLSDQGWIVEARIPFSELGGSEPLSGSRWRGSFCRYDRWRDGREPALSSTSPHAQPRFHSTLDWRDICF